MNNFTKNREIIISMWTMVLLIWSYIGNYDFLTWILEVAPAVIGLLLIICFKDYIRFTSFTMFFIGVEMAVLIIGGHYGYAHMPLFDYFKDVFELSRNHYDRVGHFCQGLVPTLVIREILIRKNIVSIRKWASAISIFFAMFVSSCYEIIEFVAANILKEDANTFLGSQGDIWDTQWDMLFALIGGLIAILLFSKLQDFYIKKNKC